jgi:hypothetical protein
MRRARQRREGKRPYGYTPEEAKIVESVLDHRKAGKSYGAIAGQLEAGGVKPRTGQKWHPTQAQRILARAKESKA